MLPGRRLDLILLASCGIFTGALAYEVFMPLGEFKLPPVTVPERTATPTISPFQPPPQSSYAVIDARPIFNPTRTPVEPTAIATGTTSAVPPDVVLVGVIIDSKNRIALVKREGAPFSESIILGALLDGWAVIDISADHVVLQSGAQEIELRMDAKRKVATTQPVNTIKPKANQLSLPPAIPLDSIPSRPRPSRTQTPPSQDHSGNTQQQTELVGPQ